MRLLKPQNFTKWFITLKSSSSNTRGPKRVKIEQKWGQNTKLQIFNIYEVTEALKHHYMVYNLEI